MLGMVDLVWKKGDSQGNTERSNMPCTECVTIIVVPYDNCNVPYDNDTGPYEYPGGGYCNE